MTLIKSAQWYHRHCGSKGIEMTSSCIVDPYIEHQFIGMDTAVSIRWTGLWDWTVGLDSEKVLLIIIFRRLKWQEIHSLHLPSMRFFRCNTAVISVWICAWLWFVIHDTMLISEESTALIIASKLSCTWKVLQPGFRKMLLLELFLCCYQVWLGWCNYSADCINMDSCPDTNNYYPLLVWKRH